MILFDALIATAFHPLGGLLIVLLYPVFRSPGDDPDGLRLVLGEPHQAASRGARLGAAPEEAVHP